MNGLLAPEDLEAIAQESRNCFLYEEAPDYLVILEQGIAQLSHPREIANLDEHYQKLVRTAHSVKGGAGLAEMPALSRLAHKLEDLLIAIQEKQVYLHDRVSIQGSSITSDRSDNLDDATSAYQLLLQSLDRVSALLLDALNNPESIADNPTDITDPVCDAIDRFLQSQGCTNSEIPVDPAKLFSNKTNPQISAFVKTALEVDLEDCLQRLETILETDPENIDGQREAIATFGEESTLIGETLQVTWLAEIGSKFEQWGEESEIPLDRVKEAIGKIRSSRTQTLKGDRPENLENENLDNQDLDNQHLKNQRVEHDSQSNSDNQPDWETEESIPDLDLPEPPKLSSDVPQRFLRYLIGQPKDGRSPDNINLRVSLSRIDRMTKTVGNLLMDYQRLEECQQLLEGAILNQYSSPNNLNNTLNNTGSLNLQSSILLKAFSQVSQRIDENRIDTVLGARNLRLTLGTMRENLEKLYTDLRAARMVPFREMTERFFVLIDNLKQQYKKYVNLVVSGQDVLIDRWILEQLQTPLTHLLRNAFDHGIELPVERQAEGKSPQATIRLSASSHGSHVVIEIADDGRGIDPEKVYQKALSKGLIAENERSDLTPQTTKNYSSGRPRTTKNLCLWLPPFKGGREGDKEGDKGGTGSLSADEIMQFLFTPGFSTAAQVTDISGRGVGLDIVKEQVTNLCGSLEVNTAVGQGTKFTITIPLTLSLLSLNIFQCQQNTLAIPADTVLEVIRLSESENQGSSVQWQNQFCPVFDLGKLLPYSQPGVPETNSSEPSQFGLVVKVKENPVVLAVDTLLGERRLILKPLDRRVPVPAYVAGCTLLGNHQVVPVLSPYHFGELIGNINDLKPNLNQERSQSNHQSISLQLPQKATEENPAKPSDQPKRILIVDDSRTMRFSLQKLLSQAGFMVIEASDGEEALTAIERSHGEFDLVISDLEMPKLDGFGFLRKLRQSQWKDMPVAMLTSRSYEDYMKKAQELGAKAYFTKPFQASELLDSIVQLVAA
jgi:chemotaxis protein histidine kinase CheA/CheY-like chemotaxis protein